MHPRKHPVLYVIAIGLVGFALAACGGTPEKSNATSASAPEGQTLRTSTVIMLMNGLSQPIDLGVNGVSSDISCDRGNVRLTIHYGDSRPPSETTIRRGMTDTTSNANGYVRLENDSEDEDTCQITRKEFAD